MKKDIDFIRFYFLGIFFFFLKENLWLFFGHFCLFVFHSSLVPWAGSRILKSNVMKTHLTGKKKKKELFAACHPLLLGKRRTC